MKMFSKKNKFSVIKSIIYFIKRYSIIERILTFNNYLFPHLYVVANFLLGIELFTYRGFTFRYMYLDTRFISFLTVLSFFIIFIQRIKQSIKLTNLTKLILEINKLAIIPLLVANYLLTSLDIYYYQNYVYAKFHININNLQFIISFNILLLILQIIQSSETVKKFTWKIIAPKYLINILFLVSTLYFVLPQVQTVAKWMYGSLISYVHTIRLSHEDKFIYLNGGEETTGWITKYTNFVNKHVPERATIFIPPQKESWLMEGNPYYIRWYIYPRFTVQSQEIISPIPDEAEYVLIDNGAWPAMKEYGWPRIFIPADKIEKIILINRDTLEEEVLVNQAYDPNTIPQKWGVIELKK